MAVEVHSTVVLTDQEGQKLTLSERNSTNGEGHAFTIGAYSVNASEDDLRALVAAISDDVLPQPAP